MTTIDIDAIQAEFDKIVNDFGTSSDTFVSDEFLNENSIILQDINGGTNGSSIPKVFLTVTTFQDQNDGGFNNGLSLRDAILRAKADPNKEYVIQLAAGTYTLTIQGNQDSLFPSDNPNLPGDVDDIVARTGDLDIETRVKIIGLGAGQTIISGMALGDRIFDVREGGLFILENTTLEEGLANNIADENGSSGGGIRIKENGTAVISNSIIKNNATAINGVDNNNGGGIANLGNTEIINSIISGNLSGDDAGGIYNTGALLIKNSTIAGNFANAAAVEVIEAGGGGIYNTLGGTLQLINSTISGNITGDAGGGILTENADTVIINSTITNNSAQIGSGITGLGVNNPVVLQNSIVAGNNSSADVEGYFTPNTSFNIIGDGNGVILDGFNNNIVGNVTNPFDPKLGLLQYNGGLTPTHALLEGSSAINGGNNNIALEFATTDQTGRSRIVNNVVDIGSYEFGHNSVNNNPLLNTPIYRFQNTALPGTYLFVGEGERQSIRQNNPNFIEEGLAFSVAVQPGDDLIPLYRFQNSTMAGTYLYVTEGERQSIKQNNPNFIEEGLAFYVFGAGSNEAQSFYRFQNNNLPGTYLFVNETERLSINQNNVNFTEEGIAFEAGI